MLVELAVGDAYGAGFEYADRRLIEAHNDLSRYVKHPRHGIVPGYYTDDTQMTLAITEMMIEDMAWTPLNLATKFVEAFKRDPREGYAGRFYAFLQDIEDGASFLAKIIPESDKSGAAMRAAPIGLYPSISTVVERCTIQARVTHNTPDGIRAAVAAALCAHYFAYDLGSKADLGDFLNSHTPGEAMWHTPYSGKVKAKGWMSAQAAVTAIMRNASLSDLLKDCIAFTGDVDTVATIALAAASLSKEYDQNLPEALVQSLENGTYGRNYLEQLDTQLMKKMQL